MLGITAYLTKADKAKLESGLLTGLVADLFGNPLRHGIVDTS